MTRLALKLSAKAELQGRWGQALAVLLISFVLLGVSSVVVIGPLVLSGPLILGTTLVFLGLIRRGQPGIGTLFEGFQRFGTAFFTFVLQGLFTLLWTLLLIVPGIVAALGYSQAWFLLADDPSLTAREALKKSKALMDGHKMEYFVLQLSFFWWALLGAVTFGLAFLYVGPYYLATMARYYQLLKDEG